MTEISYEEYVSWRKKREERSELLVDETILQEAKRHNVYIMANPVNSASYASFLQSGVQSKHFSILERTARTGLQNGYVESSSRLKRELKILIEGSIYTAVVRNGRQLLSCQPLATDEKIEVACYENGSYVVSDIDLLFILIKGGDDEMINDCEYGELTHKEKEVIVSINAAFQKKVQSDLKLIQHGPACRFSRSKITHIHFPIKLYAPDGILEMISDDSLEKLFERLFALEATGYHLYLNPNWNVTHGIHQ